MAKIVYEMTKDEEKLYNELIGEVKKANYRIRRLFSLGIKEPFAYKDLSNYLDAKTIKALTKSGYISLKRSYNLQQLLGIKRATENFLSEVSTLTGIKKKVKEYSELLGSKVSTRTANIIYQLENYYEWIYEYIPKSEFWGDYAPLTKEYGIKDWIEILKQRNENIPDEELRNELKALYIYCKKEE